MTKELFVSSTPHETKVGMVEDDLLAEIYLERENEYTLAGSIYKGRVTRVLPGMQSAFVDIGLERDAFLYVSDFMELEDGEDVEEVVNRPAPEARNQPQPRAETQAAAAAFSGGSSLEAASTAELEGESAAQPAQSREANGGEQRDGRGGWRGRRRRGRRGERMPESKFARPAEPVRETPRDNPRDTPRDAQKDSTRESFRSRSERNERADRNDRSDRSDGSDYGPPPGYQPIILPGESISKYQRLAKPELPAPVARFAPSAGFAPEQQVPIAATFPDDEPLFIQSRAGELEETALSLPVDDGMPLDEAEDVGDVDALVAPLASSHPLPVHAIETVEEEEIEEEEADLAHYVEELDEDATFEEMEEETRAAEDYREPAPREIAASVEPADESGLNLSTPVEVPEGIEAAEAEEEAEAEAEEEAEIEEAQAEAEALLAAEAQVDGSVETRAEVRAPAGTAAYAQRTPRPAFDRERGGVRGRRGGRRFRSRDNTPTQQISDLLKEGQEILVQIAKEPIGKKGARITSHIALPGRFLVYMPTVNHTGVSRKIASEEERQRLKRIILSERENGHGGFIVRTAAQGASEDELRADIRFLKGLWNEIKTRADNDKAPLLIYHDLNVVERVLRDQVTSDFTAIWVDTEQEYERVLRFANRFQPALVKRVKLYSKETPLFDQFNLNEEINKALKSKVWLKSGGYIVINQTEALVAIDVNTGKYVGKTARLEDTIVKTNVDAIKEIVRQIRLRDLGGIIIIDFIDMDERRNRQKVMQALEEALRADRAPSKVLQFNDFGLVAITRKRVKQSLERTIGSPCPYCESTGYVKSVTTVCNDIYIEMRKMAKHLDHADVMLRVNPEVAKALKASSGRALLELEEVSKKTVIVKSDPALHQEQFDIN